MRKKFFLLGLVALLFTSSVAYGWEFSVTGEFAHRFRGYSRAGTNDLFGNTNTAQSTISPGFTSIGMSGPYNGQVLPEVLSSKGSTGTFDEQKLIFYPVFKISEAVQLNMEYSFQGNLNGLYTGGSNWANPPHYAGWVPMNSRSNDGFNGWTVGVLKSAWVAAETPIGLIKIGRYPFRFGLGWGGYHSDDIRMTMITLTVPQGPLSYIIGAQLSDNGAYSDPYDVRNANKTLHTISSMPDGNETKLWDVLAGLKYQSGPVDIGFLYRYMNWNAVHAVPFSNLTLRDDVIGSPIAAPLSNGTFYNTTAGAGTSVATATSTPLSSDVYFNLIVAYFKYLDGRYFFNLEYDQEYISSIRKGARPISGYPKSWLVEGGVLMGPAKVTLANFYRSGHQRSGGQLDFSWTVGTSSGSGVTTTAVSDKWSQFVVMEGAHAAMEPYNFIIGYYGTGNNSYDSSGYPTYLDYLGYAARFDYAIASNLNIYGTYLWSYRQSNTGSWWGQYSGGIYPPVVIGSNVPNNDLGAEWNAGVDWKLLENFVLGVKVGVWKPGDWFKFAYADLSTINTITDPISGNAVFVNPERSIDQIFGLEAKITVNF